MIKKFNTFNSVKEDIDNYDVTYQLEKLLLNKKQIEISLNDIIHDSGIILELNSGKILEKLASDEDWKEYEHSIEFKEYTGASLENDYKGNKSEELLEFLNSFEHNLDIRNAYFEGTPSHLLQNILKNN